MSTCAIRTPNRQDCKSASGTQNPHHQSFSNLDAPHRQPVHLYNASPGLQKQLLTPIKEVRTLPKPSNHTDVRPSLDWETLDRLAAIAAGALVCTLRNHSHSPPPLWAPFTCHIIIRTSCGGQSGLACSQWEIGDRACPLAAALVGALASAEALSLLSVNRVGRTLSAKTATGRRPIHTRLWWVSSTANAHPFSSPDDCTFSLPHAQWAPRGGQRGLRILLVGDRRHPPARSIHPALLERSPRLPRFMRSSPFILPHLPQLRDHRHNFSRILG